MKLKEVRSSFEKGEQDERLKDIYIDEALLGYQKKRYIEAIDKFEELYGDKEIEIYSAPGRTEIGGNHTDHQKGQVLAASINLDVIAVVAKTGDDVIKVMSGTYDIKPISVQETDFREKEKGTSEALIRGVAAKLKEDGYQVGGFQAYMTSDVIVGAGLSSSAAFEVAVGTILSGLYNDMKISPVYIAQVSQYSENRYFGKPCGLMDQMASSVGSLVNIDFKDPLKPDVRKLDIDFSKFGHSLCIVDTKGDHSDLTDEYAYVTQEMRKVAEYFGCEVLREVDEDQFYDQLAGVRKKAGDRGVLRAMHFFADHKRVGEQVKALQENEFDRFKRLITESGNSSYKYLQNVFAITDVQNQSLSIGLALSERYLGKDGAYRVHGGGFAGTIQAYVPAEEIDRFTEEMEGYLGKDACHPLPVSPDGASAWRYAGDREG